MQGAALCGRPQAEKNSLSAVVVAAPCAGLAPTNTQQQTNNIPCRGLLNKDVGRLGGTATTVDRRRLFVDTKVVGTHRGAST